MGFLRRLLAGAARGGIGIARAFHEQDARDGGKAFQILHRIFHRLVHHAVNDQAVLRRVDGGNAIVMALEMQARGRDDAPQRLQRREGGGAAGGDSRITFSNRRACPVIAFGDAGPARSRPDHASSAAIARSEQDRGGGRGESRRRAGSGGGWLWGTCPPCRGNPLWPGAPARPRSSVRQLAHAPDPFASSFSVASPPALFP